ncbi:MAG: hypothetical protein HONBIEJF_00782 [Fimbriimonadaceae bacterium]|nr:hypothetical protein [Fimbriimonadaceae bacterium]
MEDVIATCKRRATEAMEMFLRNLSHVPEDKLSWSPTPTAKSALQIAAHCAGYGSAFVSIISSGRFPDRVEDFVHPIEARIAGITTVEQAEAVLRQGIAETIAALDSVKPEQIDSTVETPIGPTPFLFFMNIPANHLLIHTGQIDYLQTCWDDQVIHLERREPAQTV